MKKIAVLFSMLFMLSFAQLGHAQAYNKAIGLRLGTPLAASFKMFISEPAALEFYAGYRHYAFGYNFFNVGGMYQYHFPITSVDGLSWYVGGGVGVWFFSYDFATTESSTGIAINGAIGLDYKFANAPINLSADWLPTFQLSGYGNGFGAGWGALAVRYVLD